MNLDKLHERALRDHGFGVIEGPGNALFIQVSAGTDPTDGGALAYVRKCRHDELRLLRSGKLDKLAAQLIEDGVPGIRRKSLLQRLLGR